MSQELTITHNGRVVSVTSEETSTTRWVKEQIEKETKIPVLQQELSFRGDGDKIVLSNEREIRSYPIGDKFLTLKNLGKQIRWEHVFYIEYLGPIIILPVFYALGKKGQYTQVQTVALVMGLIHYLKRQYETAFVHVFSRQSMPFKRVIINSFHYWILFGLLNAIELYMFPSGHTYSKPVIGVLTTLWAFFELMNFQCHKVLGSFRRNPKQKVEANIDPSKKRQIPYGYGFDWVSCANYFWEALGWITFSLLTRNYTAYIFTVFSVVQMAKWALEKHRRYQKQFKDGYPRDRKAMFPFLL